MYYGYIHTDKSRELNERSLYLQLIKSTAKMCLPHGASWQHTLPPLSHFGNKYMKEYININLCL